MTIFVHCPQVSLCLFAQYVSNMQMIGWFAPQFLLRRLRKVQLSYSFSFSQSTHRLNLVSTYVFNRLSLWYCECGCSFVGSLSARLCARSCQSSSPSFHLPHFTSHFSANVPAALFNQRPAFGTTEVGACIGS